MTIKNLAYLALVAGWICFCYWLYAERISPRLNRTGEESNETQTDSLPYPLSFKWASDTVMVGTGFDKVKADMDSMAVRDEVVIVRGFYFRDEATEISELQELGKRRINNTLKLFGVNDRRILTEVAPQEITADVRVYPFEAISIERLQMEDVIKWSGDTFEVCFPLKDSLVLPAICLDKLVTWMGIPGEDNLTKLHITGTADGGGIAEPSDWAMERALYIKNTAVDKGWKEDQIQLSTGQRNHPLTLWNRCVVLYFE